MLMYYKVTWKRPGHKIELVVGNEIINLVEVEIIRETNVLHFYLLFTARAASDAPNNGEKTYRALKPRRPGVEIRLFYIFG